MTLNKLPKHMEVEPQFRDEKIAIITLRHERDEVHEIFLESIRELRRNDLHIKLYVASTHEHHYDEPWVTCKQKVPGDPVRSNRPLGSKLNFATALALADYENEYFLILGDDDLISHNSVKALLDKITEPGIEHVGTKECALIDALNHRATRFKYKHKIDKLAGAGRMLTRRAIEESAITMDFALNREIVYAGELMPIGEVIRLNHKQAAWFGGRGLGKVIGDTWTIELWQPDLNSGLDHSADIHLILNNFHPHAVELPDLLVDFKTQDNIWPYDRIARQSACTVANYNEVIDWFPQTILNKIDEWKIQKSTRRKYQLLT